MFETSDINKLKCISKVIFKYYKEVLFKGGYNAKSYLTERMQKDFPFKIDITTLNKLTADRDNAIALSPNLEKYDINELISQFNDFYLNLIDPPLPPIEKNLMIYAHNIIVGRINSKKNMTAEDKAIEKDSLLYALGNLDGVKYNFPVTYVIDYLESDDVYIRTECEFNKKLLKFIIECLLKA